MSLLELTIVISAMLSLLSILFVGARAWKKGSDRAGCILNIRNVLQAVRGYANVKNLGEGADLLSSEIYDNSTETSASNTVYMKTPICPTAGSYTPKVKVPILGTLYITCSNSSTIQHEPTDYATW